MPRCSDIGTLLSSLTAPELKTHAPHPRVHALHRARTVLLYAGCTRSAGGRSGDLPEPCPCGHPQWALGLPVQLPKSVEQEADFSATYPVYIWNVVGRRPEYGGARGQHGERGWERKPVLREQLRRALVVWYVGLTGYEVSWGLS